jgi:MraZ protein
MAELFLDGNNRLLIPKRLLDEVDAVKEIVMAGQFGKIEIWAKELFEKIEVRDQEFASLAEKIMEGLVDETEE